MDFAVEAWDCEGIDDVPDMIWFGIYRTEDKISALAFALSGNVS